MYGSKAKWQLNTGDDDSLGSKDYDLPAVSVPTLKCEALHQDYFQTSDAAKDPIHNGTPGPNSQHVTTAKQPSFTALSSNHPSSQSQDSCEHFLSHDHLQSHDQIPQSPDRSADTDIKSTSLSDLGRLSPPTQSTDRADLSHYNDFNHNPGLTHSWHEYYNTRQPSLNDNQFTHSITQSSLIGGSCNIPQNSELVSGATSINIIQQAKKRCIPKVGIRTIPLIKIKPELKCAFPAKDNCNKDSLLIESHIQKAEVEINTENNEQKGAHVKELNGNKACEQLESIKDITDDSDIVGEVIVHEPYSREGASVSPVDANTVTFVSETISGVFEACKRELSTISEEIKTTNGSGSDISLQNKQTSDEKIAYDANESINLTAKTRVEPRTPDTPKLRDKLLAGYKTCRLDDTETDNTIDSLFVNRDEDSLNTVTDILEEEFCTEFSDTEEVDNQCGEKCEEARDSSTDSDESEYDNVLEELPEDNSDGDGNVNSKVETVKQSNSCVDGIIDVEQLERRLKSRTCLSLGRDSKLDYFSAEFKNVQSDSEGTLYYSFNSLDNAKFNNSCGALSKGSRKLPLKWTPRVLLESRISSLASGTFSESSFHTADTFGTFYSARSFQLDSCDNFQTCEDFQQYNNEQQESKSKFIKAKEAFFRGRDFVKAKLDDYRKRIPNLRRINLGEHSSCRRSCGFSCVHVGKEISQYSLPDTFGIKGDNSERGDNSEEDQKGDHCEELCCKLGYDENEDVDAELRMGKDKNGDQRKGREDQNKGPNLTTTNGKKNGKDNQRNGANGTNGAKGNNRANGTNGQGTVKMDLGRGTIEDDLPVGSEALSIPRSKKQTENGDTEGKPSSKRLRWVSAVDKSQGTTSFSSSLTSNSSVEQLLTQRETDPESMLISLGFDGGPNTDQSANRIPDRFLLNPCTAKGIDIFQFVLTHPELQHLIPATEHAQQMHHGRMGTGHPLDEVDCGLNKSPSATKGSMQQHHFSSVLQGVRFLQNTQSLGNFPSHYPTTHQVPDDEMKQLGSIPSVLDVPNRRFLARQGYYGKDYASTLKNPKGASTQQKKLTTAEQKRKMFHQAGQSKNWSLTEESETDSSDLTDKSDPLKDSFDQGLMLRSFSERFSSESSLESSDSFGDQRDKLRRQSSISHLRKQYQDTIRNSMDTGDGEVPVFDSSELESIQLESDADDEKIVKKKITKQSSISDIRKLQVDRLMTAEEDDGDYFAHSLRSRWKEPLIKKAQCSTQSTLTGSPFSPKEFSYSFEQDEEEQFEYPETDEGDKLPQPGQQDPSSKVLKDHSPAVSIVIEDEPLGHEEQIIPENSRFVQSNPNELGLLHVIQRTDSTNTIVPAEMDNGEGDVTPRPGDISPGLVLQEPDFIHNKVIHVDTLSTSSSETCTTVLPNDNDCKENVDPKLPKDTDEGQGDLVRSGGQSEVKVQKSPDGVQTFLKPDIQRPQESFELEEISSADNAFEDMNGNTTTTKSRMKLGQMEKSLSTHSDSSGFADIDQGVEISPTSELPGEITTSVPQPQKGKRPSLQKQKTFHDPAGHDLSCNHDDNQATIPSQSHLLQTENRERNILGPMCVTMNQENIQAFASENVHKKLHMCGKVSSLEDTENENPSLQSISYIPKDQSQSDKSVVYSISVPIATNIPKQEPSGTVRFVSSIKFDIDSESSVDNESIRSMKITQAGPVLHQKIITDLNLGEGHCNNSEIYSESDLKLNLDFVDNVSNETGATSRSQNIFEGQTLEQGNELLPSNKDRVQETVHLQLEEDNSDSVKQRILNKKRSKEALIAATSHTADWLLNNQRRDQSENRKRDLAHIVSENRIGRPIWASTPDLNAKLYEKKERKLKNYNNKHAGKSLDIEDDFDDDNEDLFNLPVDQQTSLSYENNLGESVSEIYMPNSRSQNIDSRRFPAMYHDSRHFSQEMRQNYLPSPAHESIVVDSGSYIGSSTGMPDEQKQYIKLAKLVNGPSLVVGTNIKMPVVKFTPNIHMKDWTSLPKQKHLEEETRLMQHAVQRYKVELIAMETMLFNMRQIAEKHLNKEERMEVEEIQHLWSEVRNEVNKMEELLSLRLSAVLNGSNSYNPLDAVEIVHGMIELLREQLYHQQMCIERDTNVDTIQDELETRSFEQSSSRSVTSFDPWISELSQQMSDIKLSVSNSQLSQKEELRQSLSELKDSIISEVREEVGSTQNVKMLQLQVQAREHEIKRLKLELLQQNIESGQTRKRQTFESDV